jgi:hippurate hydrolase
MVDDGMMDRWNIQEVYAIHNWPGAPVGTFATRAGPFLAATDQFEIAVQGKGGHAAMPHNTIDTTLVASHIVIALQSVVSRNVDPVEQAVLSVTSFETESKAFNVIPSHVALKGTVRTLTNEVRALTEERLKQVATATARAYGATAEINYIKGYPAMVNHVDQTAYAVKGAKNVTGDCGEAPLVMGGEDFAYLLEARPGAFIVLGNGDSATLHHPEYNFNDEIIPTGCSWFAEMVETRMPAK